MGMTHPMSGKINYNYLVQGGGMNLQPSELNCVLEEEDRLRLSDEWQLRFAAHDTHAWRLQVCFALRHMRS